VVFAALEKGEENEMKYEEIVNATNEVLDQYEMRLTVRQIYYRLISPPYQLFENKVSKYKYFDKILTKARECGDIDWNRIEDRTRTTLGGENEGLYFDSPWNYIEWLISEINEKYYEKRMWEAQPQWVEVWVEKDALSALFAEVTSQYNVITFPCRGYSSHTKIREAIERFPRDKPVKILHFSDHDPSGLDMTRDMARRFKEYADIDITIKRIGLTIDQVRELDLSPNPTKRADPRQKRYLQEYGDECWELDAVPPDELKQMILTAIESEIDFDAWESKREEIEEEQAAIRVAISNSMSEIGRLKAKLEEELIKNGI